MLFLNTVLDHIIHGQRIMMKYDHHDQQHEQMIAVEITTATSTTNNYISTSLAARAEIAARIASITCVTAAA